MVLADRRALRDGMPDTGGARYSANIAGCNGLPVEDGDLLPTESGAKIGPTNMGIADLIAQDPVRTGVRSKIQGSCAPGCAAFSPA
jgi:hypothetical protein